MKGFQTYFAEGDNDNIHYKPANYPIFKGNKILIAEEFIKSGVAQVKCDGKRIGYNIME